MTFDADADVNRRLQRDVEAKTDTVVAAVHQRLVGHPVEAVLVDLGARLAAGGLRRRRGAQNAIWIVCASSAHSGGMSIETIEIDDAVVALAGDWHGNVGWTARVLASIRRASPAVRKCPTLVTSDSGQGIVTWAQSTTGPSGQA